MTSTQAERQPVRRSRTPLVVAIAVIAALVIAFFIFAGLYADWLWYEQLGFLNILTTQWVATAVMFAIGFFAMAIPVWISIEVAFRWRPVYAKLSSQLDRYQQVIEPLRRLAMYGIPAVLGLFAGVATSSNWKPALEWLNRTPAGVTEPQFGLDVSFYLFELPFYRSVVAFASAIVLISILAALATSYLYGALRFNGREVRISRSARIQLASMGAIYLALQAVSIWLDQYATMASSTSTDLITGPAFADVNAVIPGRAILAGIAALVAILFIVTAIIGRWRLPIVGTALLIVSAILIGGVYPWIVQRFQVDPSARTVEAEYIDRNIEATRAAYGVSDVTETPYKAQTDTEPGALRNDAETTANIRILDPALVTDAFAQLEQIKQYYQFAEHLDVDRYTIDGKSQDTVIAVRELNQAVSAARATGSTTTSSTRTAMESSPLTATSARSRDSRSSSSMASRAPATSASSSRVSISVRPRPITRSSGPRKARSPPSSTTLRAPRRTARTRSSPTTETAVPGSTTSSRSSSMRSSSSPSRSCSRATSTSSRRSSMTAALSRACRRSHRT